MAAYDTVTPEKDPAARALAGDELASLLGGMINDAEGFVDEELAQLRADAIKAYRGEPFGDEEPGRSQFVLTVVRDNIASILPSLLRTFTAGERVVQFEPTTPQSEVAAKQATELVHKILMEHNDGFLQLHSLFKDGLLKKLGVVTWGWEVSTVTRSEKYQGLTKEERDALLADDGVEPVAGSMQERLEPIIDPQTAQPNGAQVVYDLAVRVTEQVGKPWIRAVPSEEFLVDRNARDLWSARLVGHRTDKTRSELLEMGVPAAFIDAHGGESDLTENEERIVREQQANRGNDELPDFGLANRKHKFVEAYVYLDEDGDGRAELRKICTLGPGNTPIPGFDEEVEERPFAVFCPDPEPHTLIGASWADRTVDIQKTQSRLLRAIFDSAGMSVFPRMAVLDGQVNIQDVLNTAIGAPIRETTAGAVRAIGVPFVGGDLMPLVDYMDLVQERRTGRNRGAAGMSAEALQSTTPDAAMAAIQGSQEQIELLARIFAEQTLKPLFRGVMRMLKQRIGQPIQVRLRDQWQQVDPSMWDAAMDVNVTVALSTGQKDRRIAALAGIMAKQTEILSTFGLDNPLVTFENHFNVLAEIATIEGYPNVTKFFTPPDPEWQPQPPGPTPEQSLAEAQVEVERMRSERELAIKEKELELRGLELEARMAEEQRKHEREVFKITRDAEIEIARIEAEHQVKLATAEISAAANREASELNTVASLAAQDAKLEAARIAADATTQRQEERHDGAGAAGND